MKKLISGAVAAVLVISGLVGWSHYSKHKAQLEILTVKFRVLPGAGKVAITKGWGNGSIDSAPDVDGKGPSHMYKRVGEDGIGLIFTSGSGFAHGNAVFTPRTSCSSVFPAQAESGDVAILTGFDSYLQDESHLTPVFRISNDEATTLQKSCSADSGTP
jgi:hypothetical protein